MEKNGILLERFPIGSQKATKVKKKKKTWKKPIIRHFVSATTSSDHLHFVHSWWLLTETRPSKAKKKSRMRDLSVAATAVSFTLLPHFFFWVAVGSTRLGLRFTTVATGASFADRGGILPEIHFGSFASSHPTATVTNVFSTFDSPWTVNFIRLWPSVQMISNFSNFGAEFLWKFVELNFVKIRKSCRNCRIS